MQCIKGNGKIAFLFNTENTDENESKILQIPKNKKTVSNDRIKKQDKYRVKRKYHV